MEVVDHRWRELRAGNELVCEEVPNVNEDCVNDILQNRYGEGYRLGNFSAFNNCQTFVHDVIFECSTGYNQVNRAPGYENVPEACQVWLCIPPGLGD
jgi:hypothetical protein